jgi:hypothetical protein
MLMAGLLRAGVVIGAIALFSPVHDQTPAQRIEVVKAAPGALAARAADAAPLAAATAVGQLDDENRRRLALLAAQAAGLKPRS